MLKPTLFALTSIAALATADMAVAKENEAEISRGAYLATVMDCGGCHVPRGADGAPIEGAGLSGGSIGFEIPGLGIFWPANLTPDDTGLKGWTKKQIVDAVRTGVRPDGRMLSPAMPWPAYAALTDEDAETLATFLQAMPAARTTAFPPAKDGEDAQGPFFRVTLPQ
ncbi:c-type cytochrome [Roseibium aggregatum]|uniref:Cytochrome c n=1 Tax=Roseibium aggregatum TaxID=187304 RepID=A0A926P397_9HYPH|nr:c-type cytochrome [Roseibium aggregatum]MBD1549270.1 cytochrome c [Roseibium aggregatum]